MAMKQQTSVVGVFTDHERAREAVHALKKAGFTEAEIGVASSGDHSQGTLAKENTSETHAESGAATGALAGAGIGGLWGLGILAGILPAIGPAIAGGTLAAILSSAAAGAAVAGLAGALIGMGFSEQEANYYESEMKAGRTIVTVNAGSRRTEALSIIRQFGGYDMSSCQSKGQSNQTAACTTGATSQTAAMSSSTAVPGNTAARSTSSSGTGSTIQAREEKLRVDKTPVETGEVTVRKEVRTEHKVVDVPVTREEVVIERRSSPGQTVTSNSLAPGQEIRIPVKEEQVNVQKETVVAEEVSVGKRQTKSTQRVDETLRKEEIKVDKQGDVKVKENRR